MPVAPDPGIKNLNILFVNYVENISVIKLEDKWNKNHVGGNYSNHASSNTLKNSYFNLGFSRFNFTWIIGGPKDFPTFSAAMEPILKIHN